MKKILIVSTTPLQYDGITKVIFNMCDYAERDKVEFGIVLGMSADSLWDNELLRRKIKKYISPNRTKNVIKYYKYLERIVKQEHYDVVHIHGNSATMFVDVLAAKRAQCKSVITHIHNTKTNHPFVHCLFKPLLNMLVDKKLACGPEAGRFLYYEKFDILPNFIDAKKYMFNEKVRRAVRERYGLVNKFVVGHIGRFSYQKNHVLLLEIFDKLLKEIPNSQLVLVGEGELRDDIKNIVAARGLEKNVLFWGVTNEVEKIIQAMDVFVLPSLYEGFSITAIEVQTAGVPCVVSDLIDKNTKMTDAFEFVELENLNKWVDEITKVKSMDYCRAEGYEKVVGNGYDINNIKGFIGDLWEIEAE